MVLFINLLGKGLTQEIIGDGGPILWAPAFAWAFCCKRKERHRSHVKKGWRGWGFPRKFQLKITEDDNDEQNNADDDDDDESDDDDDHDDNYLDEEARGVKTKSSPESSLNLPSTVCAICLRPVIVFAWSTLRDTALVSFSVTPHFKTLLCFLYKSLPTMKHFSPIRWFSFFQLSLSCVEINWSIDTLVKSIDWVIYWLIAWGGTHQ